MFAWAPVPEQDELSLPTATAAGGGGGGGGVVLVVAVVAWVSKLGRLNQWFTAISVSWMTGGGMRPLWSQSRGQFLRQPPHSLPVPA